MSEVPTTPPIGSPLLLQSFFFSPSGCGMFAMSLFRYAPFLFLFFFISFSLFDVGGEADGPSAPPL